MTDYDFRSLSPIDFEEFARNLLNADLGLELVTFAVGPDGGIDLRDTMSCSLPVVVQCKHRPDAQKASLKSAAAGEVQKLQGMRLSKYLLVVSAALSPEAENEILQILNGIDAQTRQVWHRGKLNQALTKHAKVEERHFKLWLSSSTALHRMVNSAEWQRSEELVRRVIDRARLFVHTPAYRQASDVLDEENLLIITGSPGVGKSTLAEMLLLRHWHQGWRVVNVTSDVQEAWRQLSEENTIFFYDDFLGQTSTAELQKNEANSIAALLEKIRRSNGHYRLIMTSREQLFGEAISGPDDRLRRLGDDHARLKINLSDIGRQAKAEMLFNHLYFAFEHESFRTGFAKDLRYRKVVDHESFNPRILESVTMLTRHEKIDEFYEEILGALDNPDAIWSGSFRQLPRLAVDILFQLVADPGVLVPLDDIRRAVSMEDERNWIPALKVLEDTWIRLTPQTGHAQYTSLFDASRKDFLLRRIDEAHHLQALWPRLMKCAQIAYLLRLAGYLDDRIIGSSERPRPELRASLAELLPDLDGHTMRVAATQLEIAETREQARRTLSEAEKAEAFPWHPERLTERVELVSDLAALAFGTSLRLPATAELLEQNVTLLLELLSGSVRPEATALFHLAAYLATPDGPDWALDAAEEILSSAFFIVEQASDLLAFHEVPEWFRNGRYQKKGEELLMQAVEWEMEAINQQEDAKLMQQLLDELVSVAYELGLDIDFDSIIEKIDELSDPDGEDSNAGWQPYIPSAAPGGSDEDLEELFAKLA
ncbi:restriction endonuclease [Crystallibacter degradans]|uniref:nSTAND3 domain-containing NTPase n=1 Tax=Crystallibacter degradans TaxID=2726743 RepID=UPI00147298CC|nr:hypothetical protein [Arthrobacter sp. SF27]